MVTVKAEVRLRAYDVIRSSLDCAGMGAIRRFYKHRERQPVLEGDLFELDEAIVDEVMSRLCEVIDFGE